MEKTVEGLEKPVTATDVAPDSNKGKTYSEEAFKEIVTQRDTLKEKLRVFEVSQLAEKQKLEEEKAKATGDYSKIVADLKEKQTNMTKRVTVLVLSALGAKYGILKPEYTNLFNGAIDIGEDLEIKNMITVEKEFQQFVADNPTLFKDIKAAIPSTDGSPFKKPDATKSEDVAPHDFLINAVQQHQFAGRK